ncbi:MAG: T9SS type A sorting domain-containing protein [Bacteroidota bacterium]
MKKAMLFFVLMTIMISTRAQIYLENTYTASTGLTNLAVSGYKYILMDVTNSRCVLYNMDHSVWKTINLSVPAGMYLYDINNVSETLFNTDDKVELAYTYYAYDTVLFYYTYNTKVVNENGLELLSIPGCSYLQVNSTGSSGTKLLAYVYDYSIVNWTINTLVYSLPGHLPIGGVPETGGVYLNGAFPNPSSTMVTIPYQLPDGVNTAEIRLLSASGKVMKNYRVDGNFHELVIQTADLPKGAYVYQLKADHGILASGKLIHD